MYYVYSGDHGYVILSFQTEQEAQAAVDDILHNMPHADVHVTDVDYDD
jgi:hypothetical protein